MKLKAHEVERFLERPDKGVSAMLLYGPDQGLVSERARRLMHSVVANLGDPFNVAEIEGEALRQQPARLVEETQALSLMGGRRVVRVRQATDGLSETFKRLLDIERIEALVVIEAGDLNTRSSLRKLFEARRNAAALPCFQDSDRDLASSIRRMLREEGLGISAEALDYLQTHLGSDREVTRREIEKLALLMLDRLTREIGIEDAAAAVGDSSALGLDDLVWATLRGEAGPADRTLERLLGEGRAAVQLVRRLSGTLMQLIPLRLQVERGQRPLQVVEAMRPPLHFRQKDHMRRALERWDSAALGRLLGLVVEAERRCKQTGMPDQLVLRRLIHEMATSLSARAA